MSLNQFPFTAATLTALVVHIACFMSARLLEPNWKGDTAIDRWSKLGASIRLFTVERRQVQRSTAWRFIVVSRIALAVAIASLLLDIVIN